MRPKELEAKRQAQANAWNIDEAGGINNCYNCGMKVESSAVAIDASMRVVSKVDNLTRCKHCNDWTKRNDEEWPWFRWDGIEAFGVHYSAVFKQ